MEEYVSVHYESSCMNLNTHTVVYIDTHTLNECSACKIYKYELIHTVKLQVTLYIYVCMYICLYA